MVLNKIPYFAQWESDKLAEEIIKGKIKASQDPKWNKSGAVTPEEYERWSWNICGMACLKMILASKFGEEHKTIELAKKCEEYGGYVQNGEKIDGLFYKLFCKFLANEFQIKAKIFRTFLTIGRIKREVQKGNYFIVSVSSQIRDAKKIPDSKGGHLILITGFDGKNKTLFLHNPSGLYGRSQKNYEITEKDFKKFFAGRGILIY